MLRWNPFVARSTLCEERRTEGTDHSIRPRGFRTYPRAACSPTESSRCSRPSPRPTSSPTEPWLPTPANNLTRAVMQRW